MSGSGRLNFETKNFSTFDASARLHLPGAGCSGGGFAFGFRVFDARDAFAIEKRGDVTALVPVAVGALAHFVDEERVAGGEDDRELLRRLFLAGALSLASCA